MLRWLCASAAAVALLVTGVVHGFWSDRWATDAAVLEAADRLAGIPMTIGEWEAKEIEVKPGSAGPGVAGSVQRNYFNRKKGVSVVLALVNGRPGPVATHTPEACYGAAGYLVGKRQAFRLDRNGSEAHFWTSDAVRTRVAEETRLRLFWGWHGGQAWTASTDARLEFPRGRHPVLHKLYVLRELPGPSRNSLDNEEPCVAFLEALVPVLDRVLFRQGS